MAGLIFLWQNITTPVVVNVDYGIKPVLDSIESSTVRMVMVDSPIAVLSIDNIFPLISIQQTTNVFTDTDNTWSDSDIAWSDASAVWGGYDPKKSDKPIFGRIDSVKPIFKKVGQ